MNGAKQGSHVRHLTAEALYVPDLRRMNPKDLENYLEFLVGFPQELDPNRFKGSEIERIQDFGINRVKQGLVPWLRPVDCSHRKWSVARVKNSDWGTP